jgi:hypothetical protein
VTDPGRRITAPENRSATGSILRIFTGGVICKAWIKGFPIGLARKGQQEFADCQDGSCGEGAE